MMKELAKQPSLLKIKLIIGLQVLVALGLIALVGVSVYQIGTNTIYVNNNSYDK